MPPPERTAAPSPPARTASPPPRARRVALALGGGAARGWAHIGAIRALADAGIGVGAVAGTSMGAIVAAALAAGRLDAVERQARAIRGRTILGYLDPALGRHALLGGRRVLRELVSHLGDAAVETLPIPVALVAADLATGEEVRLTTGSLTRAVRASIAIPGLFAPVAIADRRLIDGGMVANLPIAAAHSIADGLPVIAIDLFEDYRGGRPRHAVATARAAFLMLMRSQARGAAAAWPDALVVGPAVGGFSTGAFHRADALIATGREAMTAALPAIEAVLPRE